MLVLIAGAARKDGDVASASRLKRVARLCQLAPVSACGVAAVLAGVPVGRECAVGRVE